jgi:hypothetical protein
MRFIPIIPNLFFFSAIFYCRFSGNDKTPFIVILTLLIAVVFFVVLSIMKRWSAALLAAVPIFYFIIVIVFARLGWLDSEIFIGFR